MKVTIKLISRLTERTIIADDEKNEVIIDGNIVPIDAQKFVSKISILTSSWQPNYVNNSILDGEAFVVTINNNNLSRTFTGKNKFPHNYTDFKSLIMGVIKQCN